MSDISTDFVNPPIVETLEKTLIHYGKILWDYEDNENDICKRYTIFSFQNNIYILRKYNGLTKELCQLMKGGCNNYEN